MAKTACPVLYSFRRCPYAIRARLALASSGRTCELREVILTDKPQSMLAISPKGTVPVLIDADGAVLEESLDIMLWALRQNDPERWLDPGIGSLDGMLQLVEQCDSEFKDHLDHYKYPGRFPHTSLPEHRDAGAAYLRQLDGHLAESPWLFGKRAALADMAILPFVRQFAHVDTVWFNAQLWPRLQGWLAAFLNLTIYRRTMEKYRQWRPGAEAVYFPGEDPASHT